MRRTVTEAGRAWAGQVLAGIYAAERAAMEQTAAALGDGFVGAREPNSRRQAEYPRS